MLGAFMYLAFGVLDYWAIPSTYQLAWMIRVIVAAATMGVFLIATYRPQAILSRYGFVVWSMHLTWGIGVIVMISLANRADLAWSSYYCGLMIVCSSLPVSYMTLMPTYSLGIACVGTYVLVAVSVQGMLTKQYWPLLMMNCYFLVSTMIVGLLIVTIRERYSREVYLLRRALRRDMETANEAKRQSDYLAEHDALTEMPNRIFLLRELQRTIERAKRAGTTVAVFFIDLDGFKPVNDKHGHQVGDMVLRVVAQRIRASMRTVDLVARFGGDEFVVAVELEQHHTSTIERLRRGLHQTIAGPIGLEQNELAVTASIGMAIYPYDAENANELIRTADQRMYDAKRKSKAGSPPAMLGIVVEGSGGTSGSAVPASCE